MDLYPLIKPEHALIEKAPSYVPYCERLIAVDQRVLGKTFPVTAAEAKRFFPNAAGLEKKLPHSPVNENGHSVSYFGYKKSGEWELALIYRTKDGMPLVLYQVSSDLVRIENDNAAFPKIFDLAYKFAESGENVSKQVNWQMLIDLIEKAHYTCRGEERVRLNVLYRAEREKTHKKPDYVPASRKETKRPRQRKSRFRQKILQRR